MSALADIYIKTETLETLAKTAAKKGMAGVSITVSVSDETNDYGQNVSAYVSQSKEQREAKQKKYYVGNGKVFWTDGTIEVATKKETAQVAETSEEEDTDDLLF